MNIGSASLLSTDGGHQHRGHGHSHDGVGPDGHDGESWLETEIGPIVLSVFEDGVPPRFRIRSEAGASLQASAVSIETEQVGGARQLFAMIDRGSYLESADEIPEPHAFIAHVHVEGETEIRTYPVGYEEHEHVHGAAHRDNNMRAALVHVMADAAVSVLVIVGLLLARAFGWLWMDPLAGIVGALVIASWSYGLTRDTGAILLDMIPDRRIAENLRASIEGDGDRLIDLHLWRLGPGHLGAILSVATARRRGADFYRARLARFRTSSHITVEVRPR